MPGQVEDFVEATQSRGRYAFSAEDLHHAVALTSHGRQGALRRLEASGKLVRPTPRRGFFVIVPPEFRSIGAPPLPWWLESYMAYLDQRHYYVALLTAAEWHGSAHYAVQETQVMVSSQVRPVQVGRERIRFVTKGDAARTPVERKVFDGGSVRVSTPEATAVDLIRYPQVAGGPSRIATILRSLRLQARALREALDSAGDVTAAQRLGYLLEAAGQRDAARAVVGYLAGHALRSRALDPGAPSDGAEIVEPWEVIANVPVEVTG
jgi:predicted transcriptional regulator of viral defense system